MEVQRENFKVGMGIGIPDKGSNAFNLREYAVEGNRDQLGRFGCYLEWGWVRLRPRQGGEFYVRA